ncbi:uncharacterized protein NPIL_211521 [Nephila pilipes]|uniref:Uncharacterized protein n=1 Tax=Nephila pilipes TaxID=299642 RepID=A0A8X6IT93_NEPPI|nr:uncharacterized protein NPIL_211521 [Nephila pilipes]
MCFRSNFTKALNKSPDILVPKVEDTDVLAAQIDLLEQKYKNLKDLGRRILSNLQSGTTVQQEFYQEYEAIIAYEDWLLETKMKFQRRGNVLEKPKQEAIAGKLLNGGIEELSSGLVCVGTKLGWTLMEKTREMENHDSTNTVLSYRVNDEISEHEKELLPKGHHWKNLTCDDSNVAVRDIRNKVETDEPISRYGRRLKRVDSYCEH